MTQTNLQFANQICQRMIANGMIKSQAEFSTTWLDQSASYLSSSKARQRSIPDAPILFLFERLNMRVRSYQTQAAMMSSVKIWSAAFENLLLVQMEVRNYLAWKTADSEALQFPRHRVVELVSRINLREAAHPSEPSALAKLINLAMHRKQA